MIFYAVIGASRGIGLEYVRQLAARQMPPQLSSHGTQLDPPTSMQPSPGSRTYTLWRLISPTTPPWSKASSDITGGKLDVLIHVAANVVMKGFDDYGSMEELDAEFITTYKVNDLSPIHAFTAFLPLLRTSLTRKIVIVSAGAAEHKFNLAPEHAKMAAYGMSKAASLIATTKCAVKLKDEGFVVISLNPGLVDVSGTNTESDKSRDSDVTTSIVSRWSAKYGPAFELVSPEKSISAQLKVIDGLRPSDNGLHLTRDGEEWAAPS